jgi:hypothetical protein
VLSRHRLEARPKEMPGRDLLALGTVEVLERTPERVRLRLAAASRGRGRPSGRAPPSNRRRCAGCSPAAASASCPSPWRASAGSRLAATTRRCTLRADPTS